MCFGGFKLTPCSSISTKLGINFVIMGLLKRTFYGNLEVEYYVNTSTFEYSMKKFDCWELGWLSCKVSHFNKCNTGAKIWFT